MCVKKMGGEGPGGELPPDSTVREGSPEGDAT